MSVIAPEDVAEERTAVVVLMLNEATTAQEHNAVVRTALRAGLMWRCHPCRADYYLTHQTCTCGAPRPTGLSL